MTTILPGGKTKVLPSIKGAAASGKKLPSKAFSNYLNKHYATKESGKEITHTRIGDKQEIKGGCYHIDTTDYPEFMKLYAEEVVLKNGLEYLTEKQLENDGPILVDLDLHYEYAVTERQHNNDDIMDLLDGYLAELKTIYQFDENSSFYIFIQQKPTVNRVQDKNMTKDGIHIVIALKAERIVQVELRKRMLTRIAELWNNMGIINKFEDVLDNSITTGSTNWQLFGSRKPHHDAYRLTHIFKVSYDITDGEFQVQPVQLNDFDIVENIASLSARNPDLPKFFYTSAFLKIKGANSSGTTPRIPSISSSRPIMRGRDSASNAYVLSIKNKDDLENALGDFLDSIKTSEYVLRESYDYTMVLPDSYYGPGSFAKWIRVGWALRNISDTLLIVWIAFSAKSDGFNYSIDIPDLFERWQKFDLENPNGLTKWSIMHWAKQDALSGYNAVRTTSIDYYIDQTIKSLSLESMSSDRNSRGCGDFDIANVLYQLHKDQYVCVSVKSSIWYQLHTHQWIENDSGTTLRKSISTTLRDLYWNRAIAMSNMASTFGAEDDKAKRMQAQANKILEICDRLAKTNDKKNIMTEAKELFYDGKFLEQLDVNPYLLSFTNGVVDFKEKLFRRGYPEDRLSKCTNMEYKNLDRVRDAKIIAEIEDFMRKLFPIKEIHDYMWEHLASTLIGISTNQTFNMYIGNGRNGKSVLVDLMSTILGDYKGDVPLTLVTGQRQKIGGLAPELVALKGVRYAVMHEPSEGEQINEGIMKQLTSGIEPLEARAPYMTNMVKFIPQFKLTVCSNEFMNIKSQDHGTWRRIRVVEFLSLFTENPVHDDPERPYQYLIDLHIIERFEEWKHVFMAMLVEIAFRTGGVVADCKRVMSASNSYKDSLDSIGDYIKEKIEKNPNGRITKGEITADFKQWYNMNYENMGKPAPKKVHEYMDRKFGKYDNNKAWLGISIKVNRGQAEAPDSDEEFGDVGVNDL
jgi:P4 family phage/plasmid primase-like protien